MGLDWRPLNKPKSGFEKEYKNLFLQISGKEKPQIELTFWEKLLGKKAKKEKEIEEKLLERFFEISISPYETLKAPKVGTDSNATKWGNDKFKDRKNKNQSLEEFMKVMDGYYVVELVEKHDGIPTYIAPHDDEHIFRGKFLHDCTDILGPDLIEEAYTSQLTQEALSFGKKLLKIAELYAKENNCEYLKNQRIPPNTENDSPESKAHIIFSAAKWLIWWAERGHGYEADF